MKKETLEKRTKIANDIMYYIYTHIYKNIDIEELRIDLRVSKFPMHRIFKEIFNRKIVLIVRLSYRVIILYKYIIKLNLYG